MEGKVGRIDNCLDLQTWAGMLDCRMDVSAVLGKALDVLKLSATPALAIALLSGVVLFGGAGLVSTLGLDEFPVAWRPWVGVAFLVSTSLLFSNVVAAAGRWIRKHWRWAVSARNLRRRLRSLAADEREVLAQFLLERRKCLRFPIRDGVSQGLAAANILFRSSNVGDLLGGWDFSMQPWVWEHLNANPHLVISDPAKLQLLAERTVQVDMKGFSGGRAPWDEAQAQRGRLWRRTM